MIAVTDANWHYTVPTPNIWASARFLSKDRKIGFESRNMYKKTLSSALQKRVFFM